MGETRLEDCVPLREYGEALRTLGYRSIEQFLGAAASAPEALSTYLRLEPKDLQGLCTQLPQSAQSLARSGRGGHFPLGVRLDKIRPPAVSLMRAPGEALSLEPKIDLREEMRPIRNQGERLTCVAHAAGAAAEHYWYRQDRTVDLSPQYLYWACKQRDGIAEEGGTWVDIAMKCLLEEGCCTEDMWPYEAAIDRNSEAQGPPPPEARSDAAKHRIPRARQLVPNSVPDIKLALAKRQCVAFSITVFNSWYQNDEVTRTGEILNPLPGEPTQGGHAMCFVGYEDLPEEKALGGGRFYLRNSWGARWGKASALGSGYGTIPYSYISANCYEAYTIAI